MAAIKLEGLRGDLLPLLSRRCHRDVAIPGGLAEYRNLPKYVLPSAPGMLLSWRS